MMTSIIAEDCCCLGQQQESGTCLLSRVNVTDGDVAVAGQGGSVAVADTSSRSAKREDRCGMQVVYSSSFLIAINKN